jgi:hypothetical protein
MGRSSIPKRNELAEESSPVATPWVERDGSGRIVSFKEKRNATGQSRSKGQPKLANKFRRDRTTRAVKPMKPWTGWMP